MSARSDGIRAGAYRQWTSLRQVCLSRLPATQERPADGHQGAGRRGAHDGGVRKPLPAGETARGAA